MTLYSSVNNYKFLEAASSSVNMTMAERIANGLLARAGEKALPLRRKLREAKPTLEDVQEVQDKEYVQRFGSLLRIAGMTFRGLLLTVSWLLMKSLFHGAGPPAPRHCHCYSHDLGLRGKRCSLCSSRRGHRPCQRRDWRTAPGAWQWCPAHAHWRRCWQRGFEGGRMAEQAAR